MLNTKLRVILLSKADFNALNKIIFNVRAILKLEQSKSISYEIIRGYREYFLIHVAFNKKLVPDIVNQTKSLIVVISVVMTNYHSRIVHLLTNLSY